MHPRAFIAGLPVVDPGVLMAVVRSDVGNFPVVKSDVDRHGLVREGVEPRRVFKRSAQSEEYVCCLRCGIPKAGCPRHGINLRPALTKIPTNMFVRLLFHDG